MEVLPKRPLWRIVFVLWLLGLGASGLLFLPVYHESKQVAWAEMSGFRASVWRYGGAIWSQEAVDYLDIHTNCDLIETERLIKDGAGHIRTVLTTQITPELAMGSHDTIVTEPQRWSVDVEPGNYEYRARASCLLETKGPDGEVGYARTPPVETGWYPIRVPPP